MKATKLILWAVMAVMAVACHANESKNAEAAEAAPQEAPAASQKTEAAVRQRVEAMRLVEYKDQDQILTKSLMKEIAHDGVEVGDDGGVTVLVDDADTVLESLQRMVVVFIQIVGDALIVVECHLVRIILSGGFTQFDDALPVFFFPCILHQLQAG